MTHFEYTQKHKPSQPCNSGHMTFGNRCLNCGWDGYTKELYRKKLHDLDAKEMHESNQDVLEDNEPQNNLEIQKETYKENLLGAKDIQE